MQQEKIEKMIAKFPKKYIQVDFGLHISKADYEILVKGFFSKSMDDRWHFFVVNDVLYFVRSWTDICIYRVYIQKTKDEIILAKFDVNRNAKQYTNEDIKYDRESLVKLIQLTREINLYN